MIVATTAACVIAALGFGLFGPTRYTAVTQVMIDPQDLRIVENVLRTPNTYNEALIAQAESQVRVMVSDNVAHRVIEQLVLDSDPEFVGNSGVGALAATLRWLVDRKPARAEPKQEALRTLRQRVTAKRAERTYVVDVSVWASEPEKAARIANAFVDAFADEQASARADAAARASASLTARLTALKDRVMAAEQRVEEYKKANGLTKASGYLVNENQLSELSSQLVVARGRTEEAKARYEQIRTFAGGTADPGALSEAIQSPTVAALRTQLAEVSRQDGELTSTLGPRHPSVAAVQSQARNLRRMLTEELGRITQAARNDHERAKANEEALSRNLEQLKRGLETTNDASVRLRELDREVQASRSVYESFLVRARELSEQERLDTSSIRVISLAEPPANRSSPPRTLLLLAFALVAGPILGFGLGLLRQWWTSQAPAEAAGATMQEASAPFAFALRSVPMPAGPVAAPTAPAADPHDKLANLARRVAAE